VTNVVLIDCHDLGRHLGVYGQATVSSHHLDQLAAAGVCFDNSFCTAPQCSPSRAGLYTGRYAHANGMMGLAHAPFNWRLHSNEIHLAGHLQHAGYSTALIGVQHVTGHDEPSVRKLGFDHVLLEENAAKAAERAVQWLDCTPAEPFFLNIGFLIPHRDAAGRYHQAEPDSSLGVRVPDYLPDSPEARLEFAELQGVIHSLDKAVGAVWAALAAQHLLQDTWLIFTTDHGLAMPRAKCTLYDPGIETALIMIAPSLGMEGGKRFPQLVSNVDLLPTILEMLGLAVPDNLHGRSFAGLLQGEVYQARSALFAEKTFHTAYEPQRAVRTDRYKLIWNAEAGILNVPGDVMQSPIYPQLLKQVAEERPAFEFYDLEQDSMEQENRIQDPACREDISRLRRLLLDWMETTGDPLLDGPVSSPFFDASLQNLRGNHGI